jgi:hypothetical protein
LADAQVLLENSVDASFDPVTVVKHGNYASMDEDMKTLCAPQYYLMALDPLDDEWKSWESVQESLENQYLGGVASDKTWINNADLHSTMIDMDWNYSEATTVRTGLLNDGHQAVLTFSFTAMVPGSLTYGPQEPIANLPSATWTLQLADPEIGNTCGDNVVTFYDPPQNENDANSVRGGVVEYKIPLYETSDPLIIPAHKVNNEKETSGCQIKTVLEYVDEAGEWINAADWIEDMTIH